MTDELLRKFTDVFAGLGVVLTFDDQHITLESGGNSRTIPRDRAVHDLCGILDDLRLLKELNRQQRVRGIGHEDD